MSNQNIFSQNNDDAFGGGGGNNNDPFGGGQQNSGDIFSGNQNDSQESAAKNMDIFSGGGQNEGEGQKGQGQAGSSQDQGLMQINQGYGQQQAGSDQQGNMGQGGNMQGGMGGNMGMQGQQGVGGMQGMQGQQQHGYYSSKRLASTGGMYNCLMNSITQLESMFDPCMVRRKVPNIPGGNVLPAPVADFLGRKMVRIRVERVDGVATFNRGNVARQSEPFVRVHILDLSDQRSPGRWLEKPPNAPECVIYNCVRHSGIEDDSSSKNLFGGSATTQNIRGSAYGLSDAAIFKSAVVGGAIGQSQLMRDQSGQKDGDDPDQPSNTVVQSTGEKLTVLLPKDDENEPNGYSAQRGVSYVRPFETRSCPGVKAKASSLVNSMGSGAIGGIAEAAGGGGSGDKASFDSDGYEDFYNKSDMNDFVVALPASAVVNPAVIFMFEVLERVEESGAGGFLLPTSAKTTSTNKIGWGYLKPDQIMMGVNFGSAEGGQQQTDFSVALPRHVAHSRLNLWLQLHDYYYTKHEGSVCDDLVVPTVFRELQDKRRLKKSALLISLDLIDQVDPAVMVSAIRLSQTGDMGQDEVSGLRRKTAAAGVIVGGASEDKAHEAEVRMWRTCEIRKSDKTNVHLPDELGYQFPSDGRGCFRVAFSPKTSRFLACAVELRDQSFEIRVFDLAKSQIHCVLHGHRDLIYDLSWVVLPDAGTAPPPGQAGYQFGGSSSSSATSGDATQGRLDALRNRNSGAAGGAAGAPAAQNRGWEMDEFPACVVSASSDGTVMVWEIPPRRNRKRQLYPTVTLYHPSYCYSARVHPNVALTNFFVLTGGHSYGLKVWRVDRVRRVVDLLKRDQTKEGGDEPPAQDPNAPFGNPNLAGGQQGVSVTQMETYRISSTSKLCLEFHTDDHSHITCIRFATNNTGTGQAGVGGGSAKQDLVYCSHSAGYISVWKCSVDFASPSGIVCQQLKTYKSLEFMGAFIYNFDVITEELYLGKQIPSVTINTSDEWLLLNSKDNLIRVVSLQGTVIRTYSEISGIMNSQFPIRSCISPDGKYICTGCESGRLYMFLPASGKHLDLWEAHINVQLNSPVVDVQWSRTHNFLALCAFENQEPPILVYRHLNSDQDAQNPGSQLLSTTAAPGGAYDAAPGSANQTSTERIKDWSVKWISDGDSGVLGGDKKRELKATILAQVLDHKRHSQIIDHIEKMNKQGALN